MSDRWQNDIRARVTKERGRFVQTPQRLRRGTRGGDRGRRPSRGRGDRGWQREFRAAPGPPPPPPPSSRPPPPPRRPKRGDLRHSTDDIVKSNRHPVPLAGPFRRSAPQILPEHFNEVATAVVPVQTPSASLENVTIASVARGSSIPSIPRQEGPSTRLGDFVDVCKAAYVADLIRTLLCMMFNVSYQVAAFLSLLWMSENPYVPIGVAYHEFLLLGFFGLAIWRIVHDILCLCFIFRHPRLHLSQDERTPRDCLGRACGKVCEILTCGCCCPGGFVGVCGALVMFVIVFPLIGILSVVIPPSLIFDYSGCLLLNYFFLHFLMLGGAKTTIKGTSGQSTTLTFTRVGSGSYMLTSLTMHHIGESEREGEEIDYSQIVRISTVDAGYSTSTTTTGNVQTTTTISSVSEEKQASRCEIWCQIGMHWALDAFIVVVGLVVLCIVFGMKLDMEMGEGLIDFIVAD